MISESVPFCQILVEPVTGRAPVAATSSPREQLDEAMRLSLLPQRFPFRRDVEFYGGLSPQAGRVLAYDYHWPRKNLLAASVVSIAADGLEGSLRATAFRQLLRTALSVSGSPEIALQRCVEAMPSPDISVALVCLDLNDGSHERATRGTGSICRLREGQPMQPGDIVWLSTLPVHPPASPSIPVEGLGGLVEPVLSEAGGGCIAALLFHGPSPADDRATFVLANDAAAIPVFLRDVENFLSARGILDLTIGVDVVLDELLTNTISYAFADGRMHEIVATLALDGADLVMELRDDGTPFDPLDIPEPDLAASIEDRKLGGLGMHFVRTVMDDVAYRRCGGWNVLTLRKHIARSAA